MFPSFNCSNACIFCIFNRFRIILYVRFCFINFVHFNRFLFLFLHLCHVTSAGNCIWTVYLLKMSMDYCDNFWFFPLVLSYVYYIIFDCDTCAHHVIGFRCRFLIYYLFYDSIFILLTWFYWLDFIFTCIIFYFYLIILVSVLAI